MFKIRLQLMLWIYDYSSRLYTTLFKWNKRAWGISKEMFYTYEEGTLGHAMGEFYARKGFHVMPKLENHDVFHVLTEIDTAIEDEIAMQYLLLGNGKVSIYLLGMILIGTIVFPEFRHYYIQSFKKGRAMDQFFAIEFKDYLTAPLALVQASVANKQRNINFKIN